MAAPVNSFAVEEIYIRDCRNLNHELGAAPNMHHNEVGREKEISLTHPTMKQRCFLAPLVLYLGCFSAFEIRTINRAPPTLTGGFLLSALHHRASSLDYERDQVYKTLHPEEIGEGLSNIKFLQQRYNLSDVWSKRAVSTSPACALQTLNRKAILGRISWLQKQLKLTDKEFGIILQKFPQVLQYRPDTNLEPTLVFLKKKLAINTKDLSKIIQSCPSILGFGIERHQTLQRNLDWMKERLHLSKPKSCGKFVRRCPAILTYSVDDNLDPSLDLLQDYLDLNATEATKLCVSAPTILALNFTTNIEPTLHMLQERLEMNATQIGQLCLKAPQVLTCNYSTNLDPTLSWLEETLYLSNNELRTLVRKQPTLLWCNPETLFEPKLVWLKERLGLEDGAVRKMIIKDPAILYYSVLAKMEPLLQWLQNRLDLEDPRGISEIMVKQPSSFSCSTTSNLEPTLQFYIMCIGEDEAVRLLRNQPIYFCFSLKRMKTRFDQLCDLGVADVDVTCLRKIARYKKDQWQAYISKLQKMVRR